MKRLLSLLLLSASLTCMGQSGFIAPSVDPEADSLAVARVRARLDSIRQYRPTVAVVMGGGGAKGMAHLGVLRFIEEMGIPVDLVGGTSMGALVSGLYSLGYSAAYLDSLVRSIDWTVMMSDKVPDSFQTYKVRRNKERFAVSIPFHYNKEDMRRRVESQLRYDRNYEQSDTRTGDMGAEMMAKIGLGLPDGFLFGFNVRNTLSSVSVGYQDEMDFDSLPIPFYCVATDMLSLKEKNWTSGNLVDAMRSSMAIPGYFRPIRVGGMVLVDGGTRNNFPVDIAKAMGADIIIGSEMPSVRTLSDLGGFANIAMQNITLMSYDISDINRGYTDILLQHALEGYNMLSFDSESIDDIIYQGYAEAVGQKEAFEEIARRVGAHPSAGTAAHATDIVKRKVRVSGIRVEGITPEESEFILSPALMPRDGMYGRAEIEQLLSALYGTKAFESVTYRLSGAQEPYELIFDCQKGQTHEAGLGVHIDTDEGVYVSSMLGLGTRKLAGLRFNTELKLGQITALNLDASYKPLGQFPVVGVTFKNSYSNFSYIDEDFKARYDGINSRVEIYAEDSRMVYGNVRMGFAMDAEPYENYLDPNMQWRGWDFTSRWFSTFASMRYDTFNESYFPTRGYKLSLDTRYVFDGYSIYMEEEGMEGEEHYEGQVPPYSSGVASFSFVIPMGRKVVLQPTLNAGWQTEYRGNMNLMHTIGVGGIRAGRYLDYQIPFFGFNTGFHTCGHYAATAQLDLRYRINHKNVFTIRGGAFQDNDYLKGFFSKPMTYAAGVEYGQKSIFGPMILGMQWCNTTGFSMSFSLGFDF